MRQFPFGDKDNYYCKRLRTVVCRKCKYLKYKLNSYWTHQCTKSAI